MMNDVSISEIFVIIQDAHKYVHVGLRDCIPAIEAIHNVEQSLHTHYSCFRVQVLQQKQANHLTGSHHVIHNIDVMWEGERFLCGGEICA